jgi:hypothetical protein
MANKKKTKKQAGVRKSLTGKDKVAHVMEEFKAGKLKSKDGKIVTDKDQALAIAMSEVGLSRKSLEKSEILNKLRTIRKSLVRKLYKEISADKAIKAEIISFFKKNPRPKDNQMHELAQRLNMDPAELETYVYGVLSDIISGGVSGGTEDPNTDPNELAMGIETELEHTDDREMAEKIARDHLAENPSYYTKLKESGVE